MQALTEDNFFENILAVDPRKILVVSFSADWCDSCKTFHREILPQLEKLYSDKHVGFYNINVDEEPTLADQYNVDKLPTFLFFKNRQVTNFLIGNETVDTFKRTINDILNR